jgi:hypothetical protein
VYTVGIDVQDDEFAVCGVCGMGAALGGEDGVIAVAQSCPQVTAVLRKIVREGLGGVGAAEAHRSGHSP